jgi:hypothetical protein
MLCTPLRLAFMPLASDASSDGYGVFSHTSAPTVIATKLTTRCAPP